MERTGEIGFIQLKPKTRENWKITLKSLFSKKKMATLSCLR